MCAIVNAGVSGDTAAAGLARLDWAMSDDVDGLIVELGANDALRGLDPAQTEAALDTILARAAARKLPVLMAGMQAPRKSRARLRRGLRCIYPRLAESMAPFSILFSRRPWRRHHSLNKRGIPRTARGWRSL